jgi:hypothetical protein
MSWIVKQVWQHARCDFKEADCNVRENQLLKVNSNTAIPKVDANVFHRVHCFEEDCIDHFCMSLCSECWQNGGVREWESALSFAYCHSPTVTVIRTYMHIFNANKRHKGIHYTFFNSHICDELYYTC